MQVSGRAQLVWQLACGETAVSQQQFIEPEHFLEALTKGEEICTEEFMPQARRQGLDTEALQAELRLVAAVLRDEGVPLRGDGAQKARTAHCSTAREHRSDAEEYTQWLLV